jgi:hypothetical protein
MSAVAVIHSLQADSRPTTIQNVLTHSRYLPVADILNVNIFGLIPEVNQLDAVILTYDFLWLRTWPIWDLLVKRVQHLIESAEVRIAMPQDDYVCCNLLDEFICKYDISHVYTPITNDLNVLYPRAISRGVNFGEALTGYVDDRLFTRVKRFSRPFSDRDLDLAQRVRLLEPHLGSEAARKGEMALAFANEAQLAGFSCDVSTRLEDVLLGDDWYKFLGNTRFTIGSKGGATIADPRGHLSDQIRRMRLRSPDISFEQMQTKLRMRNSRRGSFTAISPRIFESAAMGVCQILRLDSYFEDFEPWVHYLPVGDHLSGIKRVFDLMRDHGRSIEVVDAAYELLIGSGRYTYRSFLTQLAIDVGLKLDTSVTRVVDSSEVLDEAIGGRGELLHDLQTYLIFTVAHGSLGRLERQLLTGSGFHSCFENMRLLSHLENNKGSLLAWVQGIKRKSLIIESLSIPWRTTSSFLANE